MAQTGYTPILIYASGTTGNTPSAANLTSSASGAELAINYFDGKLFYKDNSGVVQVLATKGTGAIGGSNTQVQYNSSGALAGSANLTFDGTTLTANALTVTNNPTLSGGTANGVVYLNGSKVATSGSALTFDGTNVLQIAQSSGTNSYFRTTSGTVDAYFGVSTAGLPTGVVVGSFSNNDVVFYQNSNEQMRLTSTGLGIGTSSPNAKLEVNGNAILGAEVYRSSDTSYLRIAGGNPAATGANVIVYGSTHATAPGRISVNAVGTGHIEFSAGGAERARITSGGDFVVNGTSALNTNAKLSVWNASAGGSASGIATGYSTTNGQFRLIYLNSTADALNFDNGNNNATLTSGGTWTNASDARLKKNIQPIKYGLETVLASQPKSFNRVDVDGEYIGFIAQELQTQIPEVVYGDEDTKYSVDYGSLVAVAFKAIQEQQAIITDLRARVQALEAQP